MLLSTNLAREWLQIDKDLLRTSTADELSGGTNIDDLERPWTPKILVLSEFFRYFKLRRTLRVNFRWNILEIDQDNLHHTLSACALQTPVVCRLLSAPRVRTTFASSGFSVAAPAVCNSLPHGIRDFLYPYLSSPS